MGKKIFLNYPSEKIWLGRSVRTPTVRTPTSHKPVPHVRLFWRESVWPPASCEAETAKESKTESGLQWIGISANKFVL